MLSFKTIVRAGYQFSGKETMNTTLMLNCARALFAVTALTNFSGGSASAAENSDAKPQGECHVIYSTRDQVIAQFSLVGTTARTLELCSFPRLSAQTKIIAKTDMRACMLKFKISEKEADNALKAGEPGGDEIYNAANGAFRPQTCEAARNQFDALNR